MHGLYFAGQINGTAQSGSLELEIADLSRDRDLLMLARLDARDLLAREMSVPT